MGGEQAADVLATVKINQLKKSGQNLTDDDIRAIREPIIEQYENEASPYYSTARLWDDGIIDPKDMRAVLGLSIAMSLNTPIPQHNFGVFRM
jgi:acetyl-CoA carboxylase carboxyltransferase component